MHQLMKFDGTAINIQQIDGTWMFDLYAVGMALGQIVTAKGSVYANKKRIDQNAKSAEIKPVLHNAKPYITESQLYDLMLEMRTDKCRTFRKWLTNEVLPTLNRTGTYSVPTKEEQHTLPVEQPYQYRKRTYDGKLVFTVADMVHFTGLSRDQIQRVLKRKGVGNLGLL